MSKTVSFDVPGSAAYDRPEMIKRVKDIAADIYNVDIDLSSIELQSYYRADGAKVTKSLSTALRKSLPKETVAERLSTFARRVSDLYVTGLSLRAEFGEKEKVGEGVYEREKTCFRTEGENHLCKKFLVNNRRCAVVVLYAKGKREPGGRCLAYFAGNRNIYLTNFYWRHIPQNKLYFITAIRHLLGIRKVMFRNNPKYFLPIFKNGDSVLVYDSRTKPPVPTRKLACPNCGEKVWEADLYSEDTTGHRVFGCTKSCARKHSKHYQQCSSCKEYFPSGSMHGVRGRHVCSKCAKSIMMNCGVCGNQVMKDDISYVEDLPVCPSCTKKAKCMVCGNVLLEGNARAVGPGMCCPECVMKSGYYCVVCRTSFSKKVPVKRFGTSKIPVCDECSAPLPGTLLETRASQ